MANTQVVEIQVAREQQLRELIIAWRALHQDCFDIENSTQFQKHMETFETLKQRTHEALGEE